MIRRLLLIATAGTLISTAGARTLEIVEGAYEAMLGDVQFPAGIAGTLRVRMCQGCESKVLQTDGTTLYFVADGRQTPLADFLAEVERVRAAGGEGSSAVGVFYSLETGRVTRVLLHTGLQH
jgi:hypothetical protein